MKFGFNFGLIFLFTVLITLFSFLIFALAIHTITSLTVIPTSVNIGEMRSLNFTITASTNANLTTINITVPAGWGGLTIDKISCPPNWDRALIGSGPWNASCGNSTPYIELDGIIKVNISNLVAPILFGNSTFYIYTTSNTSETIVNNTNITVVPSVVSLPTREFGVWPATILLNWSTSPQYTTNITVLINNSINRNVSISIRNDTSRLSPNYSQSTLGACNPLPLIVQNSSGQAGQTGQPLIIGPLNGTGILNSTNVSLININLQCYPGRYYTNTFLLTNQSNGTENLNITIILDIPIVVNNTLNSLTGIGTFNSNGKLPINATTYQSYYFFIINGTTIQNATGVTINISGWSSSQDVDLFLFDSSGNIQAKSINKSSTSELIQFNYLPSSTSVWEIRIYGNSTSEISWQGTIIFTTLNITDPANTNQQISLINLTMNASMVDNRNITLKNEGNLTLSNLIERKELYYVKRFGGNSSQNFTVLIPDSTIAKKVKVILNWTGSTNYSFAVYRDSSLLISSVNKYPYANKTGSEQEEFEETTSIPSSSEIWRVQISNNSLAQDWYNVSVFIYVNESAWIYSNFTTVSLNRTGGTNSSTTIRINFTAQNNSLDGIYEGYISYLDSNSVGVKIPIRINVTTPMLLVNNSLSDLIARVDENYGATLNKSFNLLLTNNGSYAVVFNITNSSSKLYCVSGGCSGYFANLTYNLSNGSLNPFGFAYVNVSISFNSSMLTGQYDGWLSINTTNETLAFTSHPSQTYNLTVRLNLTNLLDIRVIKFVDALTENTAGIFGNHSALARNISIAVDIFYLNGSGPITTLNTSNFTSVWLQEGNISGSLGRVPTSGGMNVFNWSTAIDVPIYCTSGFTCPSWAGNDHYYINATVPSNVPGGLYSVNVMLNVSGNPNLNGTFTGIGTNRTLIVNNTGLFMSSNITGCSFGTSTCSVSMSMSNASTTKVFVNVTNYGPISASGATISFSENCAGYSASDPTYVNCPSTSFAPSAYNSSCIVYWNVTAADVAADACTGNILGTPSSAWFDPYGINISITVTKAAAVTTTTTTTGDSVTTTNVTTAVTTPTYLDIIKYTSLISVVQGKLNSTTVTVNNTNTSISQDVALKVENINSSWVSVSPASATIARLSNYTYTVTFSVTNDTEIKDYSGKFTASSSYASVSKEFTLRILPAEKKKVEINETFTSYKANFTKLWKEINQSKAEGVDVSTVESKFNELKTKIEQAENYIKEGTDESYFNAYQLLSSIKTLLEETKNELASARQKFEESRKINWLLYIGIGGAIAAGIFIVYLFWPTKAAEAIKVFKKESEMEKEAIWENLKEKWKEFSKRKKE